MAEDTDQHRDKRPRLDTGRDEEADGIEVEPLRQATNHDRNEAMDVDSEKVANEEGAEKEPSRSSGGGADGSMVDEATLEQLQKDMGDAFLLCRSSKTLQVSTAPKVCLLQVC